MPLILLAEEESSTIEHVRSVLSSQGWLVKTVGNRDQALRAASEFAPQLVLVNHHLAGAEDLVRTFSRRSGGPGVVLMTSKDSQSEAAVASPEVDAILSKPLDTDALIETIRRGLADGKNKPAAAPVTDTSQVLSSQEIFGDLLGDILDPEEQVEPETTAAAPGCGETIESQPVPDKEPVLEVETRPEPELESTAQLPLQPAAEIEPVIRSEPAVDATAPIKAAEKPEPIVQRATEASTPTFADPAGGIPVTGLEDLEEVVREGVEAWADSIHPEDVEEQEGETLAEPAAALEEKRESAPEPEKDADSKLDDTLAGVLAASLAQVEAPEPVATPRSRESESVDALLSRALGDLHLGAAMATPAVDEVAKSKIDDEIEALAESVEVDPITDIGTPDFYAALEELTGLGEARRAVDTDVENELESDTEARVEKKSAEAVDEPMAPSEAADEPAADRPAETVERSLEEPETHREATAPPIASASAIEFGEYTLEQQIGVGGMASVWKARRKGVEGFEKRVAIKKILPQAAENEDFVEMFIDEAKLAAQLNHTNITHIYDLGKIDDDYFIAMEYVEGRNLRQILDKTRKKQRPVPVGVALFIAARIADALDYAHRSKDFDDAKLGLVHRDVSPQNVLISYEGDIKLCDFGIAKAVSKISTTQMGALKGKLQYMSPEQAWGKTIDHRSDLFSLGTLLYEMLTGKRLFSGDSEMAVLEAVREADVGTQIIQSPDIPAGVKGVLLRALAREPGDRFESAAQLQRGLEELTKDESPAPGPKSLSAFVRDLLDMPVEPAATVEEEGSAPQIEVADDLAWVSESQTEDDQGEATPWLRRVLTRLLPVILVVAVGGGIVAGLMQKDQAAPARIVEPTTRVSEALVLESAANQEAAVDPLGQPPPPPAATRPLSAPPTQPKPQEPEPRPISAKKPPAVETAPARTVEEASTPATAAATDAELERQVEEDLQRVQELMAIAGGSPTSPVEVEVADSDVTEAPVTLDSIWSDVTAAEAEGSGSGIRPAPVVVEPRVLEFAPPDYTDAAREAGIEGTIRVSVLVGEDGRAREVRLIEGLDSQVGLEEALMEAARIAVYQPATKDGQPVEMWYQVAVPFQP